MKHFMLAVLLGLTFSHAEARGEKKNKEAFRECKEQAGFVKGEKPSKEAKEKFKQCLADKGIKKPERKKKSPEHKKAFKACREELGIEKGKRFRKLDDDTRAKMVECLKTKGIIKPEKKKQTKL
ncbi:MAG TPA: hypothetical protein VKY27_08760 [Bacteriovoracaceae bacterium]|nr:hypothetical protein [Bacteriovoracaceae bacterium]